MEKSEVQFKGVTSFVGKQRQVIHYTHQLSGCDILYMQPLLLTDCIPIQQAGKLAEFKTSPHMLDYMQTPFYVKQMHVCLIALATVRVCTSFSKS